eukprot:CAMPEP_0115321352 /NCGR_PEP_ID=MMETSP0270-20121206/80814_1 /TAXON_ID=71861 /ORGANISM="Scrippsiella trochoidea, Strain CCMP3099" /LENGTH=82 /DNA_ID=CAMNT_0002741227 /DNA_START=19 /DNA_END=263 /DNA_ORIENTATION=-
MGSAQTARLPAPLLNVRVGLARLRCHEIITIPLRCVHVLASLLRLDGLLEREDAMLLVREGLDVNLIHCTQRMTCILRNRTG